MPEIKDKILEFRQLNNWTQTEMAKKLEISSQLLGQYERGRHQPKQDFYAKWKHLFGWSLENEINVSGQLLTDSEKYKSNAIRLETTETPFMVPLMPVKARAGYAHAYNKQVFVDELKKFAMPPGVDHRAANWMYFEVDGDSMEPTFNKGDLVLASQVHLDDWENVRNFYVHIIVTEEKLLIKRIYRKSDTKWVLISDNEEEHPQELINVADIREVWVFRRHIIAKAPPPRVFEIKV